MKKKSRTSTVYFLMILMLFQGLSGILGGIGLIGDPSGRSLQIPLEWLEGSPFNNYMIPGIILLLILGLYPLIVFYGLLKRQSWSWFGALITSVALIIWIAVEILIIGYQPQPPLQLIYGAVGFIMLVLVLMPSVQMYYQHKEIHEI